MQKHSVGMLWKQIVQRLRVKHLKGNIVAASIFRTEYLRYQTQDWLTANLSHMGCTWVVTLGRQGGREGGRGERGSVG
jgi:pyrrolidone-carboxylate peptidase